MTDDKKAKFGFGAVFNGFPMPPMPPFVADLENKVKSEPKQFDKKKADEKLDDLDATIMNFWNQVIEMQKSTVK